MWEFLLYQRQSGFHFEALVPYFVGPEGCMSDQLLFLLPGGGNLFCNYLYCTRLGFGSNPQLQLAACLVLQSQCLAVLCPRSRGSVGCGAGGREQPGPISSWLPVLLLGHCPTPASAHSLFLWLSLLECLGTSAVLAWLPKGANDHGAHSHAAFPRASFLLGSGVGRAQPSPGLSQAW